MLKILCKNYGETTSMISVLLNGSVNLDTIGQMIAMLNVYKQTSHMDTSIWEILLDLSSLLSQINVT